MKLSQALKYLRTKKKIKQAEVLKSKNFQTYTRIENDKQSVSTDDLSEILNSLELTTQEFFSYVDLHTDHSQNDFYTIERLFIKCCKETHTEDDRKQLLYFLDQIEQKEDKNTTDLTLLADIKCVFSKRWPDLVSPLTKYELNLIYKLIKKKSYYTYFDYRLVCNTIILFPAEKIDFFLNRMFPIQDIDYRDSTTLNVAYSTFPNALTAALYNRNYEKAAEYLELAKNQCVDPRNYLFHFSINYYENLLKYFITDDVEYLNKVYTFISFMESTNDILHQTALKNEVNMLVHGEDKKIPKSTVDNIVIR